jgi:hypothetical protein
MNVSVEMVSNISEIVAVQSAEIQAKTSVGLNKLAKQAESKLKDGAPRDTSFLANSIHTSTKGVIEIEISSSAKYAWPVIKGTAPHFPPSDALVGWASRHGFDDPVTGAFLIARKISEVGTKAQDFLTPVLEWLKAEGTGVIKESL